MSLILHDGQTRSRWTDVQRRTVWWLICRARSNLQVEVDPVVASAFVILQKYFREDYEDQYELFYIIAAALVTSCKASGNPRPVSMILNALSNICQSANSQTIRNLFSVLTRKQVFDYEDMLMVNGAEIDLLRAINFSYDIEMPFTHLNRWKQSVRETIPDIESVEVINKIMVDICLIICSDYYLDVPPEVAAAAAASGTVGVQPWITEVKERYGEEVFNLALQSLNFEKARTAVRQQSIRGHQQIAITAS